MTDHNHTSALEADVMIVGAGPVGLTLAMDLASRGVSVVICETRRFAEPPNVKCNHVASRTMEQFRRLGVAQKLRDAGLPPDYPNDVAFRTTVTGTELTRIPIPCRRDRYTETEGPDAWWPTPEPPHRINQMYLEPILLKHTAALPGVQVLNRTQFAGFTQDDAGVTAIATVQLYGMAVGAAVAGLVANAAGLSVPGGVDGAKSAAVWLFAGFAFAPAAAAWLAYRVVARRGW